METASVSSSAENSSMIANASSVPIVVNGSQKCSNFGNHECSVLRSKRANSIKKNRYSLP